MKKNDETYVMLENYVKNKNFCMVKTKMEDMVFEDRVKLSCFYCSKYNSNWKCRGQLPKDIEFESVFSEYENLAFVYHKAYFTEDNFSEVRTSSSIALHNLLIQLEGLLWENNYSLVASFIGGSCKLCKNGCGKDKCNNPGKARTPLEATGLNVIKSAQNANIEIIFPPKDYIMRIGLIMW